MLPKSTVTRIEADAEAKFPNHKEDFNDGQNWRNYLWGRMDGAERVMPLVEALEKIKRMGLDKQLYAPQDHFLNMLIQCTEQALSNYNK